jgi:hypothetical protein
MAIAIDNQLDFLYKTTAHWLHQNTFDNDSYTYETLAVDAHEQTIPILHHEPTSPPKTIPIIQTHSMTLYSNKESPQQYPLTSELPANTAASP